MSSQLEKPVSAYSSLFHPYLGDDEVVLWSSKSPRRVNFQAMDIIAIPFTFLWFGVVLTVIVTSLMNSSLLALIPLIPFVFIGFYISIGRFIWSYYKSGRIYYAVTNNNAYILTRGRREYCQTLFVQKMTSIRVETWHDGGGNIIFDQATFVEPNPFFTWSFNRRLAPPPAFEKIVHVKQVYHLIRRAQEDRAERPVLSSEKGKNKGYLGQ